MQLCKQVVGTAAIHRVYRAVTKGGRITEWLKLDVLFNGMVKLDFDLSAEAWAQVTTHLMGIVRKRQTASLNPIVIEEGIIINSSPPLRFHNLNYY